MAAPKGNNFYLLVKKPTGRPKQYTPGGLWKKAQDYFEWVSKHPYKEVKAFGTGHRTTLPKLRAMTEDAFCLFAAIDESTFKRYKNHEDYKDFWTVSRCISKIIYLQKFEGAAADLLNPNIIARDLGLKDQSDITSKGEKINTHTPINLSNVPLETLLEFARHINDTENKE